MPPFHALIAAATKGQTLDGGAQVRHQTTENPILEGHSRNTMITSFHGRHEDLFQNAQLMSSKLLLGFDTKSSLLPASSLFSFVALVLVV